MFVAGKLISVRVKQLHNPFVKQKKTPRDNHAYEKYPFMVSWEPYCLDCIIETQVTTITGIEYIDTFAHNIGFCTH